MGGGGRRLGQLVGGEPVAARRGVGHLIVELVGPLPVVGQPACGVVFHPGPPRHRRQRDLVLGGHGPGEVGGEFDPLASFHGKLLVDLQHDPRAPKGGFPDDGSPLSFIGRQRGHHEAGARGARGRLPAPPPAIRPGDEHNGVALGLIDRLERDVDRKVGVGSRVTGQRPHHRRFDADRPGPPWPGLRHGHQRGAGQGGARGDGQGAGVALREGPTEQVETGPRLGEVVLQPADDPLTANVEVDGDAEHQHLGLVGGEPGVAHHRGERAGAAGHQVAEPLPGLIDGGGGFLGVSGQLGQHLRDARGLVAAGLGPGTAHEVGQDHVGETAPCVDVHGGAPGRVTAP